MKIIHGHVFPGLLLAAAYLSSCGFPGSPSSEHYQVVPSPSVATTQMPQTTEPEITLPVLGIAPEFTNEVWLNTDSVLRLADLKGKVVLIDFWTFS